MEEKGLEKGGRKNPQSRQCLVYTSRKHLLQIPVSKENIKKKSLQQNFYTLIVILQVTTDKQFFHIQSILLYFLLFSEVTTCSSLSRKFIVINKISLISDIHGFLRLKSLSNSHIYAKETQETHMHGLLWLCIYLLLPVGVNNTNAS